LDFRRAYEKSRLVVQGGLTSAIGSAPRSARNRRQAAQLQAPKSHTHAQLRSATAYATMRDPAHWQQVRSKTRQCGQLTSRVR